MDKFKVYCETDGWVHVVSSAEPTVCPNNSGHTLRAGSAAVIQQDIYINDGTATERTTRLTLSPASDLLPFESFTEGASTDGPNPLFDHPRRGRPYPDGAPQQGR